MDDGKAARTEFGPASSDTREPEETGLPRIIAIDGPAGAGKTTVGRLLAERLHYLFLDTGVMYRAVSLASLREGIAKDDEQSLAELAERLPIHIKRPMPDDQDGRINTVLVGDEDVTWEIRRPEVEAIVSIVASWPRVRAALVRQQRGVAARGPVVMVGRDITTEVLPDADLKIYLDASLHERARRRFNELVGRGRDVTFAQVEEEIKQRDNLDMNRQAGPLRIAPDAVQIDTDGLTIEQALDKVLDAVKARGAERA